MSAKAAKEELMVAIPFEEVAEAYAETYGFLGWGSWEEMNPEDRKECRDRMRDLLKILSKGGLGFGGKAKAALRTRPTAAQTPATNAGEAPSSVPGRGRLSGTEEESHG